ncbi:MAG: hypothetical protein LIO75_08210 [Lachnospiraceae bacterium]|nr:hypothetical protein [Lachnospiraceae bacterium]
MDNTGFNSYFHENQVLCCQNDRVSRELTQEMGVKTGLRDVNGEGVLAGRTSWSCI